MLPDISQQRGRVSQHQILNKTRTVSSPSYTRKSDRRSSPSSPLSFSEVNSQSEHRESDEWESERETNWTNVDIGTVSPPAIETAATPVRKYVPVLELLYIFIYKFSLLVESPDGLFEKPRSRTLFGSTSWNVLPLANFTNRHVIEGL